MKKYILIYCDVLLDSRDTLEEITALLEEYKKSDFYIKKDEFYIYLKMM